MTAWFDSLPLSLARSSRRIILLALAIVWSAEISATLAFGQPSLVRSSHQILVHGSGGVIVERVVPGSAAAKAGVREDDLIISYSGRLLASTFDLTAAIENMVGSTTVSLMLQREGKNLQIAIPVGRLGVETRVTLSSSVLSAYKAGVSARQAGRLEEAAAQFEAAARADGGSGGGWLWWLVGEVYLQQHRWEIAQGYYEVGLTVSQKAKDRAAEERMLVGLAKCAEEHNDFVRASNWYEQALKVDDLSGDQIWATDRLNDLGAIASQRGDLTSAESSYKRALEIHETLAPDSLQVARSLSNLGNVALDRGDLTSAEAYYKRAHAIFEKVVPDSLQDAATLLGLGGVAVRRSNLVLAETFYKRALAIYEKVAPDTLQVAMSLTGIAAVYWQQGDMPAAEGYYIRALAIQQKLAPESLDVAGTLTGLGAVAFNRGNLTLAESYHKRALAINETLAPDSLQVARSLSNLGGVAMNRGDLPLAEAYLKRALAIKEKLAPESLDFARSLHSLAGVTQRLEKLSVAQELYERALALLQARYPESLDMAACYHDLGNVAYMRADQSAARKYYTRALALREKIAPNSLPLAEDLSNLGVIATGQADMATALDYHRRALAIRKTISPGSLLVAESILNIGTISFITNDLASAEELFKQSKAIAEKVAPNSLTMARSLLGLGALAAAIGDLPSALDYTERAIPIQKNMAPLSRDVASSLLFLGNLAMQRADYVAAQNYLQDSLRIFEKVAPNNLEVANVLNVLGNVAIGRAEFSTATSFFSQALTIEEKIAPDSLSLTMSLVGLGVVAGNQGSQSSAERYFKRSLAVFEQRGQGNTLDAAVVIYYLGITAAASGNLVKAHSYLKQSLGIVDALAPNSMQAAIVLDKLGAVLLSQKQPASAVPLLARAVTLVERHRAGLPDPEARSLLLEQHTSPFTSLLQAYLALNRSALAFSILERLRARSLVEALTERGNGARTDQAQDSPRILVTQRQQQTARRTLLSRQMVRLSPEDAKGKSRIRTLRQEMDTLDAQIRETESAIRRASPRFAALAYPQPLSLAEAQQTLDAGTLLLAWALGENESYLFAITHDRLRTFTLSYGRKQFEQEVGSFVSALQSGGNYQAQARALYQQLLAPAESEIQQARRLLLSPDGPLHLLPFCALVVSRGGHPLVHLLKQKPLHVCVSISLYQQLRHQPLAPKEAPVLALVAPEYPQHQQYPRPSGTQATARPAKAPKLGSGPVRAQVAQAQGLVAGREDQYRGVDERAKLLNARGLDLKPIPEVLPQGQTLQKLYGARAKVLTGNEATIAALKQRGPGARLVHLACHGLYDSVDPLSSVLALTPSGGDDGLLCAYDIIQSLQLSADLVMLSACETGRGGQTMSEGLIGLTRALQYAGARSVGVSLWSVDAGATTTLMQSFYRALKGGASKDVALQQAQEEVRSQIRWQHPRFWAAFQIIGDWK